MVEFPRREEVLPMISKEVFMDIISLKRQGYSVRKIAETLGIHGNTVKRHLERVEFPQYHKQKQRGRYTSLTPRYISAYPNPSRLRGIGLFTLSSRGLRIKASDLKGITA